MNIEEIKLKQSLFSAYGYAIFRLTGQNNNDFMIHHYESGTYIQGDHKKIIDFVINKFGKESLRQQMYLSNLSSIKELVTTKIEDEIIFIDNFNYNPCENLIYSDNHRLYYNIYRKSKLLQQFNPNEDYGWHYDIQTLLLNLCENNKTYYMWVCRRLAWILQHPTEKVPTSIIFQGAQGSGKSAFKTLVLDLIFGDNIIEINQSQLNSDYNDYMEGKLVVVGNEVIYSPDKYTLPERLKNLITDSIVSLNKKYQPIRTITNYSNWILCTNSDHPMKIDNDDRRYSIFRSQTLSNPIELIQSLLKTQTQQVLSFISFLYNLKVIAKDVYMPIQTAAKTSLQGLSSDSCELFLNEIIQEGGIDKLMNIDLDVSKIFEGGIELNYVYSLYRQYCINYGIHPRNYLGFCQKIPKSNNFEIIRRRCNKIRNRYLVIKNDTLRKYSD